MVSDSQKIKKGCFYERIMEASFLLHRKSLQNILCNKNASLRLRKYDNFVRKIIGNVHTGFYPYKLVVQFRCL